MKITSLAVALLACCLHAPLAPAATAEHISIGMATNGASIDALVVAAPRADAPTVVLVGGLRGDDASATLVRDAVATYERGRSRRMRLLAVPVANPSTSTLAFPPTGVAYRENAEAHTLWRWLGTQAPDLVLVVGEDPAGLAAALGANVVADMGRIPARAWDGDLIVLRQAPARSEAHAELGRRLGRSPRALAQSLGQRYGRDFDQPWYIGALALTARLKLGDVDDVRRLAEPWVDGTKDSLARPNALVMAGHVVFTELARRTGDPRYTALVRRVADLGFDADRGPREAMPFHEGYSDSVFMGTAIVAQAGALTGERRYLDMADRHLRFMQQLDLRADGLYRHHPQTQAAWGRGNGFAALGLALTLSALPADHPGYAHALQSYRTLMDRLLPLQTHDGLWRNVLDHPAAYPEFSATAMFGFALQRGLQRGWIRGKDYERAVARAWRAVNARTSGAGTFIDVCESTARVIGEEAYLGRAAILGEDPRAAAMAMLFATELMED